MPRFSSREEYFAWRRRQQGVEEEGALAIEASDNAERRFVVTTYAGFWLRLGALAIDSFALGIGFIMLLSPLYLMGISTAESSNDLDHIQTIVFTLGILLTWIYSAVMESSTMQGTLGKRFLRVRVVDVGGRRITFWRATGRYWGKLLSSIFLIGFVAAAFTPKKQALHDILAGCHVVRG